MRYSTSLRTRLTAIILGPLVVLALLLGLWASGGAMTRAADRFDRSLLSTALAISRDVAVSGGDALSRPTRDLIRSTSGGPVFYHVFAPDGVFVTGYATPPVPPEPLSRTTPQQVFYDSVYQGEPVRVLRFIDAMTADGLSGDFTITVWQNTDVRRAFVNSAVRGIAAILTVLLAALAMLVWFGVRLGLRPLGDIEEAISKRSSADLTPIRRPIPPEIADLVSRLNGLLRDLSAELAARDRFISDAAHQLRNPVAGVLSLAEAVRRAGSSADLAERADDLVEAARDLRDLADGLLSLERARSGSPLDFEELDPCALVLAASGRIRPRCEAAGIALEVSTDGDCRVLADRILLEQSILNLLTNALIHGGPQLSRIGIDCRCAGDIRITVRDDGRGIAETDAVKALSRFGQIAPSSGSGLGLPIAQEAIASFGGTLSFGQSDGWFEVRIVLPVCEPEQRNV